MKTLGIIAATCFVFCLSGSARAERYASVEDPSGGAMCFSSAGDKAPLSACESEPAKESFLSRVDPSGASMCFAADGSKAPLAKCGVVTANTPAPVSPLSASSFVALLAAI